MLEINDRLNYLFDEISEIASFLWQKGWAERNGGNISINITDFITQSSIDLKNYPFIKLANSYSQLEGNIFWITSTGSRVRDLKPHIIQNSGIIRISAKPKGYFVLWHENVNNFKPTSELASHLKIHQFLIKNFASENVILHTHPNELIALTHIQEYLNEEKINKMLWSMMPEVKVFIPKGIGLVSYKLPGSEELAKATIKSLQNHKVVLWEKHGCLAIGTSLTDAFDTIDMLNKASKIFFLCKNAGYKPQGLSEADIKMLSKLNK